MDNYTENYCYYCAMVESISIISSATTNKAKEYLGYLKTKIECLLVSNRIAEKDYKFVKSLIKQYLKQFKQYHSTSNTNLILKDVVNEEIKKLTDNVNIILKNCDKKYLNQHKKYEKAI